MASSPQPGGNGTNGQLLLDVKGLRKFFPIRRGFRRRVVGYVRAVDDVDFFIKPGETLALVGESGCGKTTTSRCILRAIEPTAGEILFRTESGGVVDVATLPRSQLRPWRRQMQALVQAPFSSLHPPRPLPPDRSSRLTSRSRPHRPAAAISAPVAPSPSIAARPPHRPGSSSPPATSSAATAPASSTWPASPRPEPPIPAIPNQV